METQNLGLGTPETKPPAKKLGGIGQAILMGGGLMGGGTIVFSAFELIRSEPDKAFKLLHDWGPWCILCLVVTVIVGKLGTRCLDLLQTFGVRIADAMDSQAEAMQKMADKDDRNLQEVQTLTSLTAQRSEKSFMMMQQFHEDNQVIMRGFQKSLDRIEAKVDAKVDGKTSAETSQT
jgi:hypothetical protein